MCSHCLDYTVTGSALYEDEDQIIEEEEEG